MVMLQDSQQRAQATDPRLSFIVQAPAGSGKTEILTQRFLRLLGTVSMPEQIVALTFTRKAANEMRERILHAVESVSSGMQAHSEHQQKTYAYARDVLDRDHALHWQLLQQPTRLRIITIDSLCQTLTQAIPLQDKHIHYAQISDNPRSHYLTAAKACLTVALEHTDYQPALKVLLEHLDNRQDTLLSLFTDLLANRDQWLTPVYQAKEQDKEVYEQALQWIEQHELTRFRQTVPAEWADELVRLSRQLATIEGNPNSPRYPLRDWICFDDLDARTVQCLSAVILTSQNTLRKAFDHHVGLKRGECSNQEYDELKTASKQLLSDLETLPDFLDALLRVKDLPHPEYDENQWDVLQALFTLLPMLAAQLNLVFNDHNEVDFSAISQQALQALGDEDDPTDLALYLDNRIHHILVDEFQDTSIQQFQLLQRLVYGWEEHDGKTLFIVGDPMQSIYRFRAAEVGLFLRAKEQGIGSVHLIPLELCCNFRSTQTIVDWVNNQFKAIFPARNDIESGAVCFHPAVHVKPCDDSSLVQAVQYANREEEARNCVKLIAYELQTNPSDSIAVLVRARSQLTDILRQLQEANIPFQGVDIDLLAHLPHLRDVWCLTQALLMPANRISWLALLRSPWCGLSLADLHAIANKAPSQSIYMALSNLDTISALSEEGRTRAQFVYHVLHTALAQRHQQPLVDWIMTTLSRLHLTSVLTPSQQDDLEQFWILIEQFECDGRLSDLTLFKEALNTLYSKKVTPSSVQIMTIHKSKGLEFDCVILPSLGGKSANKNTPLLRWLQLPTDEHDELLLLSPMKAAHHEHCALYDYLGKLDAQKNAYEQQRLLYVAVTRAKKRLYLFDSTPTPNQGSFRHLLNQTLFITAEDTNTYSSNQSDSTYSELLHLPLQFYQQTEFNDTREYSNPLKGFNTNATPRLIGIVAHELLQWICNHHPSSIEQVPWALATHALTTAGFYNDDLKTALMILQEQMTRLFNDPIGQWIIKSHEEERNEYELLTEHHGETVTRIIDRTFVDNQVRWIIDFKTGRYDPKTHQTYEEQLNNYGVLLNNNTPAPIRCGLYYLNNGDWFNWDWMVNKQ
jgi:ATP-dependent helicase/nuclease subunit A